MHRNLFWGSVAFYPLVTGLLFQTILSGNFLEMPNPVTTAYLFRWCCVLVYCITIIIHSVYFIIHVVRNPNLLPKARFFWVLAFLLFFATAPFYWWFQSKAQLS
jgi:hypothetical protein